MNEKIRPYRVIDFPPERRVTPLFLDLKAGKHCMYGLLEVDVTAAKQFIEDYKAQTGETLSFTGYLAFCLSRAVAEYREVQAYRKGGKQLVIYDDVHIGLMVEQKTAGKPVLTGHVIRGANHKTYLEIHREIRSVQFNRMPASAETASWFRSALLLPWPLSRLIMALIRLALYLDPKIVVSMAGTVGITSVGMFGEGQGGWGLSPGSHALDLIVGSTAWKPGIVEGRIEPRELLNLTVVFDHDVIDGAPAARFTRKFIELIESGYGLDEDHLLSLMDTEPAVVWAV